MVEKEAAVGQTPAVLLREKIGVAEIGGEV